MVKDGFIERLKQRRVMYASDEFVFSYAAGPLMIVGIIVSVLSLWFIGLTLYVVGNTVHGVIVLTLGWSMLGLLLFILGALYLLKFMLLRIDDQLKEIRFKLGIEGPVIADDIIEKYKAEIDKKFKEKE